MLLSRTVEDLKEELEKTEERAEIIENEKDDTLSLKDAEIAALRAKMEDMAQEFAGMLNGTLDKMHERIELRFVTIFELYIETSFDILK